jgi:hypothetical protein
VIDAYATQVANVLKSPGQFSGDSTKALQTWTDLTTSEAQYRKTLMAEIRKTAPVVDSSCWWVVLETHPDATPEQVIASFRKKMKECHPDRVAGLAAPIQELAKEMAQRQEMDGRQWVFAKPTSDRSTFCGKFASVGRPRLVGEGSRKSCDCEPIIWVFAQKSAVCPVGRWSRLHALYQAQGFPLDTECDRWDRSSGMRATARARQRREGCSVEGGVET